MTSRNRQNPKEIFDNPDQHLDFLTESNDRDFEGQYFDRKEVCRPNDNGIVSNAELKRFKNEQIAESVSAFANGNREGGLLVLGISSTGDIPGLSHLNENQINSIGNIDNLVHHNSQFKLHQITLESKTTEIALIYVPYVSNAICETVSRPKRAWKRNGIQNIELDDNEKDRIKRDKRIVDYERTHCSKYREDELDKSAYQEFSVGYLNNTSYEWTTDNLLHHLGAIDEDEEKWFTNAGKLFFSAIPERDIPQAYIRLLRFDVSYDERENRPNPTYDKNFTGSLTKQIRDFRTFIKDSAFFEIYQRRKEGGGFIEEPEYPSIAVDEAVVNAVAHRDYAITRPILCEKYTDAFIVISPGSIMQDHNVPEHFSLDDTNLQHCSRNPKIMEWLRQMKDAHGRAFVQALQEGTRKMRDEMAKLNLPAPEYITTDAETRLILKNNALIRKDASRQNITEESPEYTNLYPLIGLSSVTDYEKSKQERHEILSALKSKLVANGWFIDKFKYGKITAHRKGVSIHAPSEVSKIVKLYPAYEFQIREYFGKQYLLVDYTVTVQSVMSLSGSLDYFSKEQMYNLRCMAQSQGWSQGKITGIENDHSSIFLFDYNTEEKIPNNKVIPRLPIRMIKDVLKKENSSFDLTREIRKASFGLEKNASKNRSEYTQALIEDMRTNIFPLNVSSASISVSRSPLRISSQGDGKKQLRIDGLKEPQVEFSKQHTGADVRQGITEYGSYDNTPKNLEIIPLCNNAYARQMEELINRLRTGKYKYKGSERTFGVKLTYNTVINAEPENLEKEISRLLEQHPEWIGDSSLQRVFLVHCPETGYAIDDENSPYYKVKRLLFESGIPCQMVDTPTLQNPDWKDLNLALNIIAKCGQTPWVLPESIPDCDFFIGLSYTQSSKSQVSRLMAFANVFNQYGRWEFYSGGSDVFSFEERTQHYEQLVKDTLSKLTLSEEPTICFHYTAKFSKEDKNAILKAAESVRPNGTYVFVWINTHHNVRLYDNRAETNGSVARGRYVKGSENQIYLSTTGHNSYRKTLGTPLPLELNIFVEGRKRQSEKLDLRVLASQILSLTKLNWASTDSLCAEPITTKYAGDIAYLTAAFLRQGGEFKLHPILVETPWFI